MIRKALFKFATIFGILIFSVGQLNAQGQIGHAPKERWGYGGSIIYNFQADGFGADLRLRIPLKPRLYFVPEFSYFPSFNRYHEFYAGGALQYDFLTIGSFSLYLLAGAYYNNWINWEEYVPGEKKHHNFAPEAGGGIVRNRGCIRPFIENRYDFKWKENNLRIGIYYYPGGCQPRRKKGDCPAYTLL